MRITAMAVVFLSLAIEGTFGESMITQGELEDFKRSVLKEMLALQVEVLQLKDDNLKKSTELYSLNEKVKLLEQQCSERNDVSDHVINKRQVMMSPSSEHVAFTAYKTAHVHNLSHDQPIVYDKVLLNDQDAYDTTTGVFTAPVSGVYLFSYSVGAKALPNEPLNQYDVFTRLVINGVHQLSAVAESTATYDDEQGSSTAILYVEEGARVWTVHQHRGGDNLYSDASERITSFTGALLYFREPLNIIG